MIFCHLGEQTCIIGYSYTRIIFNRNRISNLQQFILEDVNKSLTYYLFMKLKWQMC